MNELDQSSGGFNLEAFEAEAFDSISRQKADSKSTGELNCTFYSMYKRPDLQDITIIPVMMSPNMPVHRVRGGNLFQKLHTYKDKSNWKNWKLLTGKSLKEQGVEIPDDHKKFIANFDSMFYDLTAYYSRWGFNDAAKIKVAEKNLTAEQTDQFNAFRSQYRLSWVKEQTYLKCLVVSTGKENKVKTQQVIELKPGILMFDRFMIADLDEFLQSQVTRLRSRYTDPAEASAAFLKSWSQAEKGKTLDENTEVWKISFVTRENPITKKEEQHAEFKVETIDPELIRLDDGTMGEIPVTDSEWTDYNTLAWYPTKYDINKYVEVQTMLDMLNLKLQEYEIDSISKNVDAELATNNLTSPDTGDQPLVEANVPSQNVQDDSGNVIQPTHTEGVNVMVQSAEAAKTHASDVVSEGIEVKDEAPTQPVVAAAPVATEKPAAVKPVAVKPVAAPKPVTDAMEMLQANAEGNPLQKTSADANPFGDDDCPF